MNFFHYTKKFAYNALPPIYFRKKYKHFKQYESGCDHDELERRLNYYFKIGNKFPVPANATAVKDYRRQGGTNYYLDLKEFLHYFSPEARFSYHFGDETHINAYPTLFKAREIGDHNANSILFKLNKRRHFKWVTDKIEFADKKNELVWRGSAYHPLRRDFVKNFWEHPLCNIRQTNSPPEAVAWQGNFMPIQEQLQYKIIFCPEGNDVATNLKWAMSSNSLCFMPKPKHETWFMEGILKAGVHYVEINEPYDELEEKIRYYSKHIDESEQIIRNAHAHVKRFQNPQFEDLLCLKVLERYLELSGQQNQLRF